MTDPAEIRAEGRRLREACESPVNSDPTWITATDVFGKWVWENLDALLADPAPSDEVAYLRDLNRQMGAKLDRLSAAPVDDRERVPEGWRVEWRWERNATMQEVVYGTFDPVNVPVLVPVSPSVDPEEKPDA